MTYLQFVLSLLLAISNTGSANPTTCRYTQLGQEYMGKQRVTAQNIPCQFWGRQTPHKHDRTLSIGFKFPDGNEYDAQNYCRNPDSEIGGPWCYTVDPNIRWQHCDIPYCSVPLSESCKKTRLGQEYKGTLSITNENIPCQAWGSKYPHNHTITVADGYSFPDGNEYDAKNYCRNPGGDPGGPWCYTVDPHIRWRYCDVPQCAGEDPWLTNTTKNAASGSCRRTKVGQDYKGTLSVTVNNITCQAWGRQYPHEHSQTTRYGIKLYPDGDEYDAKNYCRNPDGDESGPWCYTVDPRVRWENCKVPYC